MPTISNTKPENMKWGTYGKCGTQPLEWKTLGELSDSHLVNILVTQEHLSDTYVRAIRKVLLTRKKVNGKLTLEI